MNTGGPTRQWSRRPTASAPLPLPGAAHRQRYTAKGNLVVEEIARLDPRDVIVPAWMRTYEEKRDVLHGELVETWS
jgi:hypothetical protein